MIDLKIIAVAVTVFLCIAAYQQSEIYRLEKSVKVWQSKSEELLQEKLECTASLSLQNSRIEEYKINEQKLKKVYEENTANIMKEVSILKLNTFKKIHDNLSCEEQLNIITQDQTIFFRHNHE